MNGSNISVPFSPEHAGAGGAVFLLLGRRYLPLNPQAVAGAVARNMALNTAVAGRLPTGNLFQR
ncbi:hypothetical protein ACNKHP_21260 [Shigella boydii]